MKISMENTSTAFSNRGISTYNVPFTDSLKGVGEEYEITSSLNSTFAYENKGKSSEEIMMNAGNIDVTSMQNKLTVMSNTMSEEAYQRAVQNGDDIANQDPEDAHNILDCIKLEMIKGGTVVEGFTDTLDREALAEVSVALQNALSIDEMTEGMKAYFVAEKKPITIENLYLSKFSAAPFTKETNAEYFRTEAEGYLARKGDSNVDLSAKIKDLIEKEGLIADEETIEDGEWLVRHSLPVDKENIMKLREVNSIQLPLEEAYVKKCIDVAMFDGKPAKEANLTKIESDYELAVNYEETLQSLSKSDLHAQRILMESHLKMTTEANLSLIRSGYYLDTKDLESYVDALKKQEEKISNEEKEAVNEVMDTVSEVKSMPVMVIGKMLPTILDASLKEICAEGSTLLAKFEEANIKYEQVFTEVRKDLGDSIQKAFQNVDAMLGEMDLLNTPENERAVRILGYNSMEITKENIERVRKADSALMNVLTRLTPKDTLKLIRSGSTPIEMSVSELKEYLDDKETSREVEMEKYSKFLYKLEKSKSITEEERREYIDTYRLIRKLEKTEFAAIGGVLKTGKELSFANLKEAIQTSKHRNMNVKIDETFGFLVSDSNDEEDAQYIRETYKELKENYHPSEPIITTLMEHELPLTMNNIIAADGLLNDVTKAFRKVRDLEKEKFESDCETIASHFSKDEAQKTYGEVLEEQKEVVYEAAMESDKYIDVRDLKLLYKQLSMAVSLSREETFEVPMMLGKEVSAVSVKVVHNKKEEPNVVITTDSEALGHVSARFTINQGKASGYVASNSRFTVTKLKRVTDIFGEGVVATYASDSDSLAKISKLPMKDNDETVNAKDLYEVAKTFLNLIGELNED